MHQDNKIKGPLVHIFTTKQQYLTPWDENTLDVLSFFSPSPAAVCHRCSQHGCNGHTVTFTYENCMQCRNLFICKAKLILSQSTGDCDNENENVLIAFQYLFVFPNLSLSSELRFCGGGRRAAWMFAMPQFS